MHAMQVGRHAAKSNGLINWNFLELYSLLGEIQSVVLLVAMEQIKEPMLAYDPMEQMKEHVLADDPHSLTTALDGMKKVCEWLLCAGRTTANMLAGQV